MKNPFEFGRELEVDEIVDRDREVAEVVGAVEQGGTLFIIGPCRYGKTSIKHLRSRVSLLTILAVGFLLITQLDLLAAPAPTPAGRRIVSLDGTWQIAEGGFDVVSAKFERQVPVPGLVDMATPPFVEPGPRVVDREQLRQKDPRRDAFWYRRTFHFSGPLPAVARLKIGKAMYANSGCC